MQDHFEQTPHGRLHWLEAGAGTPLLLLHSNGCSAYEFDQVIEALSRQFRVIAWDMPGHGDSDPITRHWSVEDYAAAVIALMDALKLEQAYVAGASIGGLICVELGARYPQRMKGVVIVEAMLQSAAAWQGQWALVETVFGTTVQSFEEVKPRFRELTPAVHRRWNIDRGKAGVKTMMDVMWAIREYDGLRRATELACPVALIYGEVGPVKAIVPEWQACLPGARQYMLPGCGHFPMIDAAADFEKVLLESLRNLRPAGR